MKQKIAKLLIGVLCLLFIAILFFKSDSAVEGVKNGLDLCAGSLIPSLFPFMTLANFISYSGIGFLFAKPIGKICKFLFNIPERFAYIVLLSFIGGYPVGAALIHDLYKQNLIDKSTASRMLCFCVNAGPAMIVFAVGYCMYNSIVQGFILWGCHLAASMIIGAVIGVFTKTKSDHEYVLCQSFNCGDSLVSAVENASKSMLIICGFVVFFSCISNILPESLRMLTVVLEVTTGCKYAVENAFGIYSVSAILGFSGLSVMCQVYAVSGGTVKWKHMIASRTAHAILSALLTKLFLVLTNQSVEVISNGVKTNASPVMFSVPFTLSIIGVAVTFLLFVSNSKKN